MSRVLTPEAEAERAQFHADGYPNCSCHISPPCGSCTHPGNPLNQDEDESCWVEVVEITIRRTGNEVEVLQGEATTLSLTCGEVIEQVLGLIYSGGVARAYPMLTPDEWKQRSHARQAHLDSLVQS